MLTSPGLVASAVCRYRLVPTIVAPLALGVWESMAPTVVTPLDPEAAIVIPPELLVIVIFAPAVKLAALYPLPLPIKSCPLVGVTLLPVPPLVTASGALSNRPAKVGLDVVAIFCGNDNVSTPVLLVTLI